MQKRTLTTNEISTLILLMAIILGAWLRVSPAWLAGFPVNDGGMFYKMILDLQANSYTPPSITTYNNLDIPFAYPPLTFYIGAVLSELLNISPLVVLRWVPGVINTLCIAAFYFLAREILGDKLKSALATLVFAITPRMGIWLSMGGGLTRSFGMLFMLLTIIQAHRLFSKKSSPHQSIFWGMVFGGLTLLTHPESSIFAFVVSVYMWCTRSRSLRRLLHGGLVSLGALVIAGPWYGFVIYTHGIDPFLSALRTGGQSFGAILRLINFDSLTQEVFIDILGVLGLLGMIYLFVKREYFIPGMFVLIYLVQPRSAHTVGNIPLAMAASIILGVLPYALSGNDKTIYFGRLVKIFIAIITPYLLANMLYSSYMLSLNHLSDDEIAAFAWAKENSSVDSRFLVLTSESETMCDAVAEWFPALSERTSLATVQGREWLLSDQFGQFLTHSNSMKKCINGELECIERESSFFGGNIEYIFVSLFRPVNGCFAQGTPRHVYSIVISLRTSSKYEIVYENTDTIIFHLR